MMEPEKTMDKLSGELEKAIKAMGKAKKLEDRVACSEVVKNLSSSLGVFLSLATDMMMTENYFDEDDDEYEDEDDDDAPMR